MNKFRTLFNTVRYLKASQIYYRLRKMAGFKNQIGHKAISLQSFSQNKRMADCVHAVASIHALNHDPLFLGRFNADELLNNRISLLHKTEYFSFTQNWHLPDQTALWNYNLHYQEYLFSLLDAYEKSGSETYLKKSESMILNWIHCNHPAKKSVGPFQKNISGKEHGAGWDPYPIDLRLTNWLAYYTELEDKLSAETKELMIKSIYQQYVYLTHHMEKDILGNHYFEDLKTVLLCSIFFKDQNMTEYAYTLFLKECQEQILPDGMHYELSPMYHKLIFESLLRVSYALSESGFDIKELKTYIQRMLDALWSMEQGLSRTPLFNDSGDNVAKSTDSLINAAESCFGLKAHSKTVFKDSGFYIFSNEDWKMIVDAGQPGPAYIPGHAHCDALSFELFYKGTPVIVNCGSYAYQDELRSFFRSTSAHNTMMIDDTEQSECWSNFRMGKRSKVKVIRHSENSISAILTDQAGNRVKRTITLGKELKIHDVTASPEHVIKAYLHVPENYKHLLTEHTRYQCDSVKNSEQPYAPEYGKKLSCLCAEYTGHGSCTCVIPLKGFDL